MAPIGEYLYPLVHTAVRQFSARNGLSADEIDDLDGEAFLHVFQQIRQRYSRSKLEHLGAALIYLMVRDCHVARWRQQQGQVQTETLDSDHIDTDLRLIDTSTINLYEAAETRALWQDTVRHLDEEDRQTLNLLETHYCLCEDQADSSLNLNDVAAIRKLHALATKHMAVSLGVHLSTAYRRTARLYEHMRQLIDARLDV